MNSVAPALLARKGENDIASSNVLTDGADKQKENSYDNVRLVNKNKSALVTLNARGTLISIPQNILILLPNNSKFDSMLSECFKISLAGIQNEEKPIMENVFKNNSIYIDSNPEYVQNIVDYLKTGTLHFSHNAPLEIVEEELCYWGYQDVDLSDCCWNRFCEERQCNDLRLSVINTWKKLPRSQPPDDLQHRTMRTKLWIFFEQPFSSKGATVWFIFMSFVIILSAFLILLEPSRLVRSPSFDEIAASTNISVGEGLNKYYLVHSGVSTWLPFLDMTFAFILDIDFIIRLIVSPKKLRFCLHIFSIGDIIANFIAPGILVTMHLTQLAVKPRTLDVNEIKYYILLLRLPRLQRLMETMMHNKNIKIIIMTLWISIQELLILILLLTALSVLHGTMMFYAEIDVDTFSSPFQAQWYTIITMTTVGYGDFYPKSPAGYCFGFLCVAVGIIFSSLTTTLLINKYISISNEIETYLKSQTKILKFQNKKPK